MLVFPSSWSGAYHAGHLSALHTGCRDLAEMRASMSRSHQAKQFHVGLYIRWGKCVAGEKKEEKKEREGRNANQLYMGNEVNYK